MAETIYNILVGLQNLGTFAYNHPYITAILTVTAAYVASEGYKNLKSF